MRGDPTGVPAELKSASRVEHGKYLARAADCEACHTAEGGAPFAGGRAFVLPFGTLYSTNITPDKDTGIGDYSDADFVNAVHKGIGRNGTKLYPAMPFASYTYMTDADALAIKAYLFSLQPVHAPAPQNTLSFPFNQRSLMGVWAMLFNPDKRFEPRAARDPQWNRGAYLAEAMGHCGECHTPRNLMQALDHREKFAGAVQAGWRAYNITSDPKSGIGAWSEADLGALPVDGPRGRPGDRDRSHGRGRRQQPSISDAGRHRRPRGLCALGDRELRRPICPNPRRVLRPHRIAEGVAANGDSRGKAMYAGACAGCHDWTGVSPVIPYATLTGVRSVNDPTATNVVQVVLSGRAPAALQIRQPPCRPSAAPIPTRKSRASPITSPPGSAPSPRRPLTIAALDSTRRSRDSPRELEHQTVLHHELHGLERH